jgi:hypothetical protein
VLDMGRSNPKPVHPLKYMADMSLYPWVNLNGTIAAALMLHRQGYPAFEIGDRAILRAVQFLRRIAGDYNEPGWWVATKKRDVKWIAHVAYGLSLDEYPIPQPVGADLQIGWTDWTHPTGV